MKTFGPHDRERIYGHNFKKRLENVGFKVTVDNYVKKFTSEEQKRYGVDQSELAKNN